jgi:N-acetylglucosaminyl-diphospho-decaprenol L-rhamnosyltransferase
MLPILEIVIVNWNTGTQLQSCLDSLERLSRAGYAIGRVVVVDNASADGSADGLRVGDLPVAVIRNAENRGFGAACNQGAAGSRGDYLLFLNPDTELFESSVDTPIAFMESVRDQDVGICGAGLVDGEGRPGFVGGRFPSWRTFAGEALGLSHVWPARFPPLLVTLEAPDGVREIDAVMGAFFLIRTALFLRLGGFDERFFMYLEDVDLSLRARQLGFRSVFLGGVTVRHIGGLSSGRVPGTRLFYALRSRLTYGLKHYGRADAALLILVTILEFWSRLARAAWRRSGPELSATVTAYLRLARSLPALVRRSPDPPAASRGSR